MAKVLRAAAIAVIPAAVVLIIGAGLRAELRHHAQYGHWISYGWHGDVISEIPDSGRIVPGVLHTQKAVMTNFTLLPTVVEACIAPNDVQPHEIPVFPFRLEKLNRSGKTWETWPPSRRPTCLNLPIRAKVVWPLKSYSSIQVPVAAIAWFRKGDWIRFVGLSKCDKPDESHREFISRPFQLTEGQIDK
jgi:hypothetical protein